jgi:hypothetical protein
MLLPGNDWNMMEEIDSHCQFESCLKTLVEVTKLSGNIRNDLRRNITTVSNLREVYNKSLHVVEGRTSGVNNLENRLIDMSRSRQCCRRHYRKGNTLM